MNRLYFGDNLGWLRNTKEFPDASVALVYLITLEKPTKQMRAEAADAGRYSSKLWHDKDYPGIQILILEALAQRHGADRRSAPAKPVRHGSKRSRRI